MHNTRLVISCHFHPNSTSVLVSTTSGSAGRYPVPLPILPCGSLVLDISSRVVGGQKQHFGHAAVTNVLITKQVSLALFLVASFPTATDFLPRQVTIQRHPCVETHLL